MTSARSMSPRIAVLLSGCGAQDGSDPHETVLVLVALTRHGLRPVPLSPDLPQAAVVDHAAAVERGEPRNAFVEAARLARGRIWTPGEVSPAELRGLVVPGGAGAVRTLCPGGPLGGGEVLPEVAALVRALRDKGAPLGSIGLGDIVLARCEGRPLRTDVFTVPADGMTEAGGVLFAPGSLSSGSLAEIARGIDLLAERMAALVREVSKG